MEFKIGSIKGLSDLKTLSFWATLYEDAGTKVEICVGVGRRFI
jgi:hypothetical protein